MHYVAQEMSAVELDGTVTGGTGGRKRGEDYRKERRKRIEGREERNEEVRHQ